MTTQDARAAARVIEGLIPGADPGKVRVVVLEEGARGTHSWTGTAAGLGERIAAVPAPDPGPGGQVPGLVPRPGDLVHIAYGATGLLPATGETYAVEEHGGGPGMLLRLDLVHHTVPAPFPAPGRYATGEGPGSADPLSAVRAGPGPGRVTVVRDGRVVHDGPSARAGAG